MPQWIQKSTSITVKMGPFVDKTDGDTAETGLTITQPDVRLSKNGGAFAQKAAAQTLTHDEKGYYGLTLDATDTDTLGRLTVHIHESGALPVWQDFMVVPTNVWDSMFGTDALQVDTIQISGSSDAADKLEESAKSMTTGAAISGTLSTTRMSTNLTESTNDHFVGKSLNWNTGALAGQSSDITAYDGVNKILTFTALTEAPVAGDDFVIS